MITVRVLAAACGLLAQFGTASAQTKPWRHAGGVFRCADGELMLVVGNDGQFARTCAVLGAPELASNPKFIKNNGRIVNGKEIMAIVASLFLKDKVAQWLVKLEEAGIPCGPVNDFAQVFADPHVQERGMRVKVKHRFEPELPLIRNALTFSETPVTEYRAPPTLGEHTREILSAKLAYDDTRIAALKEEGVI